MKGQKWARRLPTEPWKRKMGVEFSGLERSRDFMVAIAFFGGIGAVAAIAAFLAFG